MDRDDPGRCATSILGASEIRHVNPIDRAIRAGAHRARSLDVLVRREPGTTAAATRRQREHTGEADADHLGSHPTPLPERGMYPGRRPVRCGTVSRTATCVWRVEPALVLALDEHLGPPVDSYVNGTQTWLTDDGPGEITLEWRLHPVAGYRPAPGSSHYDLWEQVLAALCSDVDPDALELGSEHRTLRSLWDGLECFAAYGEEIEPAPLAQAATDALRRAPDAVGLVDHDRIGVAWEQAKGTISITEMLLAELRTRAAPA